MAKLPGKRSKTRRIEPARLIKSQREYVEKKLTKRQASYFRKLSPKKQKDYADQKLSPQAKRVLREKGKVEGVQRGKGRIVLLRPERKVKPWGKRPLPAPRRDAYGRERLTREQGELLRKDIRKLRARGKPEDRRRIEFMREQALHGRFIRAQQVSGFEEWGRIMRGLKSNDKSARGPKARALVMLGLRDPDWGWDVGDTPSGAGRTLGRSGWRAA